MPSQPGQMIAEGKASEDDRFEIETWQRDDQSRCRKIDAPVHPKAHCYRIDKHCSWPARLCAFGNIFNDMARTPIVDFLLQFFPIVFPS